MTFETLRTRFLKNIWMVIIAIIVANLSLFSATSTSTYLSTITVGMNPNNLEYKNLLTQSNNFAANNYDKSLEDLSLYLVNRFSAPDIQFEISESAKLNQKIDNKKAFYDVKTQNAGFVNLTYNAGSRDQGQAFINSVNTVFQNKIIKEWNSDRPSIFAITPKTIDSVAFNNAIIESKPSFQNNALPSVAGIIIGFLLALFIPPFGTKNKTS
jgi:capsular polysaccharide biosynthesis protein